MTNNVTTVYKIGKLENIDVVVIGGSWLDYFAIVVKVSGVGVSGGGSSESAAGKPIICSIAAYVH